MAKLKNKSGKVKNRKNKLHLVFDEDKRREFLLGFHKRKLQRKKKAEEEMKQQLKEERIRLKQEARERYKKLVVSKNAIPDFESESKKEYKTGNVSVNVISLSTDNIAQQNNWIGLNKPQYESENDDNESEDLNNSQVCSDNEEKQFKYKTKKDVKKDLRKQATKTVQKSKIFQRKYKVDKRKMKKKSRVQKNERIKTRIKKGKKNNLNNINK